MNHPNQEDLAGAQCAEDIACAILNAMGEVMKIHGNDPHGIAWVAAGMSLAASRIDANLQPGFKSMLIKVMELG